MIRRSFIQKAVLGTIGASIIKPKLEDSTIDNQPVTNSNIYMTESGIYGKDSTFVLGFLKVENPSSRENWLLNRRDHYGYRSKLTYRSNDRHKITFTKYLIAHFRNNAYYQFHALHSDITGQIGNVNASKLKAINDYKIDLVNEMKNNIGINTGSIITKYQSLNGPSESFRSHFEDETGFDHDMVLTRDSNLLQLSSYLTSTVAAMINDKINHPVKAEITNYFKQKTGISDFNNSFSNGNISFYR